MSPTSIMGIHLSRKVDAKEYRTFKFQAEGLSGNAKLLERAVSFRMTDHLWANKIQPSQRRKDTAICSSCSSPDLFLAESQPRSSARCCPSLSAGGLSMTAKPVSFPRFSFWPHWGALWHPARLPRGGDTVRLWSWGMRSWAEVLRL